VGRTQFHHRSRKVRTPNRFDFQSKTNSSRRRSRRKRGDDKTQAGEGDRRTEPKTMRHWKGHGPDGLWMPKCELFHAVGHDGSSESRQSGETALSRCFVTIDVTEKQHHHSDQTASSHHDWRVTT